MAFSLRAFKTVVFLLATVPLLALARKMYLGQLGPDPGQYVTESLGMAAFQLLLATLLMTPLARWTSWSGWIRVRRILGLYTFFYACLHVLAFLQFILGWGDLLVTFTKRPYIVAGFIAFVLMVPLALTSTSAMMRRLGRRWKPLHRLIYLCLLAAWVHFLWQARSDVGEMVLYGVLAATLILVRVYWFGWRTLIPIVIPGRKP